jgi:FlaA1/EpsC-like NDP-sugar epimerase
MRPRFTLPPLNFIAILHDGAMAAASFVLALYLRLSARIWEHTASYLTESTLLFTAMVLVALLYWRAYRHLWRYTSLTDLMVIARGATLALLLFYLTLFGVMRLENVPRSIPVIHWMTLMLLLMAPRVAWRLLHDRALIERLLGKPNSQEAVLLVGATPQAEAFIRESTRSLTFPYRAVGLIDNDTRQHGREILHVRIYGGIADIETVLRKLVRKEHRPKRIILAAPTINRLELETIMAVAQAHNLTIGRLPSLTELKAGDRVHDIRAVAVEDILGRPEAALDRPAMCALVEGKRVLITGAGGSIGSELVRQIIGMHPAHLTLFEQSEYQLYLIDQVVGELARDLPRTSLIGDVRDAEQLARAFATARPEIVFHAAAIKHVPLAEANPDQAVLTNILGSKHVADACVAHKVGVMVQISTDKAVNPTSVMGATKRAAEIYCHMLAGDGAPTRFVTVRFGNVLGSTGSVVPLFQKQIARGGPVTVTHPEMTRYFMSIGEAVQLVLQAAALGVDGDDRAPIFVLDMGEPVRIVDLAEQMIRLAGLRPGEDIEITFSGLRPGEKLFEELFHDAENMLSTRHPLIHLARARAMDRLAVLSALANVIAAAKQGERSRIPALLTESVADYTPDTGIAA